MRVTQQDGHMTVCLDVECMQFPRCMFFVLSHSKMMLNAALWSLYSEKPLAFDAEAFFGCLSGYSKKVTMLMTFLQISSFSLVQLVTL